jgi:Fic family protein
MRASLVPIVDGGWAFVPPPLPPDFDWSRISSALACAAAAIGELRGIGRLIPDVEMLVAPLERREALTSSAMEGMITTLPAMLLAEADDRAPANDNAREAINYMRALNGALSDLKTLPLSHRVINNAHRALLNGLSAGRGAHKHPGEFKKSQNAVGRAGGSIAKARYVPPPPAETQPCMDALEQYLNRDGRDPASCLIDLALVHYQFEAIHPYDDGNGRIGRLLVTLMAIEAKLLDQPLLHVSARIERNKDEYLERLYRVSTRGDWLGWINFFLAMVAQSAGDAVDIAHRMLALQSTLREKARAAGKPARLFMVVDALFARPWTTAPEIQKLCNVTFPTAQRDLKRLVANGILKEIERPTRRLYIAPDILNLAERI